MQRVYKINYFAIAIATRHDKVKHRYLLGALILLMYLLHFVQSRYLLNINLPQYKNVKTSRWLDKINVNVVPIWNTFNIM